MSDALISSLQKRVDELTSENASLKTEAKQRRLKAKSLAEENDQFRSLLEEVQTDRDGLKAKADAKPGELQAELDRLKGEIRTRDHRDVFTRLAKDSGVTQPKALEDLWSLSGYKAETDTPDDKSITAAISTALQGRDWLKTAPPPDGGKTKVADATTLPGPGQGRGPLVTGERADPNKVLEAKYPNAFRIA